MPPLTPTIVVDSLRPMLGGLEILRTTTTILRWTGKHYGKVRMVRLVIRVGSLWSLRQTKSVTELTATGIIVKTTLTLMKPWYDPMIWRCWHKSLWTIWEGLSHTMCMVDGGGRLKRWLQLTAPTLTTRIIIEIKTHDWAL